MIASAILPTANNTSFTPAISKEIVDVKKISSKQEVDHDALFEKAKNNITIKEYVGNYFSDIPVMVEIARCESRFRQHDKDGEILRGVQNSYDTGIMQINEFYHSEEAEKLGYNLLTLDGNLAYARYLFNKYGVRPWESSYKCWSKTQAYQDYIDSI